MRLRWRAWGPWSTGDGCPGPCGLGCWEGWLWPSLKLREQGSVDGLQNVSLSVLVTDQEAAAARSPNGVFPTAQRHCPGSACETAP